MRVRRWLIVVACAAVLVTESWLEAVGSDYRVVVAYALYASFGIAAVVQVVRMSRRTGHLSHAVRPGMQGLGEVQDMYLGRKPVPPMTYAAPEGVVAELSIWRTDPLDDPTWIVGPAQGRDGTHAAP
jgi:hypothetical protein